VPTGELGRIISNGFVGSDFTVANIDDAVGVLGNVIFVSNKNDGVAFAVQIGEKRHDFFTGSWNRGCRWARRPERWTVNLQEPGNGDALALTAGEFIGLVIQRSVRSTR